jgi:hypothetical protein
LNSPAGQTMPYPMEDPCRPHMILILRDIAELRPIRMGTGCSCFDGRVCLIRIPRTLNKYNMKLLRVKTNTEPIGPVFRKKEHPVPMGSGLGI